MTPDFVPKKIKAQQLFAERLMRQIEEGRIRPGEHLLPERELCRHYRLGRRIVRGGLAQLEAAGYIGRFRGKGTVVLERPRAESQAHGKNVAVIILERVQDNSTTELVDSLQQKFQRHGFGTTLYVTHSQPEVERKILAELVDQRVAGAVLYSCHPASQYDHLAAARNNGLRLVLVDHYFPGFNCPSVSIDDEEGGFLAANHLLRLGRSELVYVTKDYDWTSCRLRGQGVEKAVRVFGHGVRFSKLTVSQEYTADLSRSLAKVVKKGGRGRLGIVAVNDVIAWHVIECLRNMGWSVPTDAAVVGFNDDLEVAIGDVPLTTIEIPRRLIGYLAGWLLCEQISGMQGPPEAIHLAPRLVVRDSCGGYPELTGSVAAISKTAANDDLVREVSA